MIASKHCKILHSFIYMENFIKFLIKNLLDLFIWFLYSNNSTNSFLCYSCCFLCFLFCNFVFSVPGSPVIQMLDLLASSSDFLFSSISYFIAFLLDLLEYFLQVYLPTSLLNFCFCCIFNFSELFDLRNIYL